MFQIEDGRKQFYQWDLNRKLIVNDPEITEAHFYQTEELGILRMPVQEYNGMHYVEVPNKLFWITSSFRVYAYCGDYTIGQKQFSITAKEKPDDYAYTETEVMRWEDLEQRANEALDAAEEIREEITASVSSLDNKASYLDSRITDNSNTIDTQDKRITNLEHRINSDYFITDNSIAYEKIVTENVCPYAQVNKIGGITYKCKNLLKYPYYHTSRTHNGITFTDNGDGSITLNGKNDGTKQSIFYLFIKENKPLLLKAGTYTRSLGTNQSGVTISITDGNLYFGDTFTLTEDTKLSVCLKINKGCATSFDNITVYPMLNSGKTTLLWEQYFEGLRDTKVTALEVRGANLLNPADFTSGSIFAIKISSNKDGAVILNGTQTGGGIGNAVISKAFKCTKGTYTFSTKDTLPKDVTFSLVRYIGGQWDTRVATISTTNPTATFEWTEKDAKECALKLSTNMGMPLSFDNTLIYPMLNKGSTALPYTPYRTDAIDTFTIAEEIQAIEGYGQSNPNNPNEYNYIDFERKVFVAYGCMNGDKWSAYEKPIETDISEYLTDGNFIGVVSGGTITAINEHNNPAPTSITYLLKEGSI